jgi:ketosteroid isomerase-like protein
MDTDANVRVVLALFAAIEQRDAARFLELTHPEFTIRWPPSLPWNAGVPGRPDLHGTHARSWLETWEPLQPTAAERQMHAQVIAAADDRLVARWRQRGRSPAGQLLDSEVLGLYQMREGRLAWAQMFYFDTDAVRHFLDEEQGRPPTSRPAGPSMPGR